jgi:hypothetical protein
MVRHGRKSNLSNPLNCNGKHISHAALRLYDARCAGVAFEFAPQTKNLDVDAAIKNIFMQTRRLQQVLAAERALRRIEEREQQGVLTFSQRHWSAGGVGELPGLEVELPAAKSKAAAFGIARRRGASDIEPAQYGADTREQFAQIERLRQIIISAKFKPNDAIYVVAPMTCNDDDRHVGARSDLP